MNTLIKISIGQPFLRPLFIVVVFALGSFALIQKAQAVSPPLDGGYAGGNTAEGQAALLSRTTGGYNTAVGLLSLRSLTTGSLNTAIGAGTLLANTADENTATGAGALLSNTTGTGNTATGGFALVNNTEGSSNTAVGDRALQNNTIGRGNVANGFLALFGNTTGGDNVAIGDFAGEFQTTGYGNVYIGAGMRGVTGENAHTYILNINATSVSGGGADFVTVDLTTGLLGHLSSSQRYKENIKPMENTSEALYRLKPVTYRYKKEIDRTQSLDYGLVAEDVANVDPNLAIRDRTGQIESVRYSAINAMLLNEFLKEHRRVEVQDSKIEKQQATIAQLKSGAAKQEATISQLKKDMKVLTVQLKEQAAQIQRVSAQMEAGRPPTKVVVNNP